MSKFLEVNNLNVSFPTEDGMVRASNGVTYSVGLGETLAIVGESGSGKSVSNLAVMGLHNPSRTEITGEAILNLQSGPIDVIAAQAETVRKLRGKEMAMIFQDPMSALHPFFSIGDQIAEAWHLYNKGSKADGKKKALEMLELVGIPDAAKRVNDFPHQFSGGMRQRAMIAMALVNNPSLLIADEPTTALDVTVQSQILSLLKDLQKKFNMAIILITHDLGVVAEFADRICVMYGGRIVEDGTVEDIFYRPKHPYTLGLLNSVPRITSGTSHRLKAIPGQPPSLINLPKGCSFAPRCEYANKVEGGKCATEVPTLDEKSTGHLSRCFLSTDSLNNLAKDKA
ncbi:DppD ABC-type dipeptide/oligopeptide/nickel transport system, ATPase component [Candidatus Nanopelagicaceae bacterium]|jgi:peptide/nickel transport system ATP-binding protein